MFFVTPCFRIFFVALVVFDYWNASGEIILGDLSSRQIKQGEENDLKNYREHYIVKYHHNKSEIMIENDIVLSPTQYHESNQTRKKRFVMKNGKWPNGEIPYVISKELHSFASDIEEAIADYERETCLKFIDGASSENKVVIHAGEGCWSNLGFLRGEQWISLGSGCKSPGTVRHELGHTIGFHHTHDRPDRDQYVTIVTKNLMDGVSFDRVEEDQGFTYGIPYDYRSIMHYVSWACSKNGLNTIVTKDRKFQDIIGESDILSFRDIKTINLHYECANNCPMKTCPGEGFVNKDCVCVCPDPLFKKSTVLCSRVSCQDTHSVCPQWGKVGFCTHSIHSAYLKKNCRRTCATCGANSNTNEESKTSTTKKTSKNTNCVDSSSNCSFWASQKYCLPSSTHHQFMIRNCKRSCNQCK